MALIKPPPKKGPGGTGPSAPTPKPNTPGQPTRPGSVPVKTPGVSKNLTQKAVMVSSGKVTLSTGKAKAGGDIMAMLKGESKERESQEAAKEKPQEKIEEKVFQIPGMRQIVETPFFKEFAEKIAPRLSLPATSRQILQAFSNIDVTAEKISQILKANPYFEYQFLKVIENMSRREEMPSLEAAVILLGMQNSRNTIIALQLQRTVQGGHAEWTKEGKLRVPPNELLRYALKTEEVLAGNKSGYADTAYSAGLMFDYMAQIALALGGKESKRAVAYIDHVFMHGMRSAQIAMEIAKFMPEFGFKKYLFSACLIHDIGKIAMSMLSEEYLDFVEECSKKELPRALRFYVEQKRFGVTHALFGAMCCRHFRMFRLIEDGILHHHDPYVVRANRNLYQLTAIVCLASNIANHFKKVDKADDPTLALWKGLELKELNIDLRQMMSAVSRVV